MKNRNLMRSWAIIIIAFLLVIVILILGNQSYKAAEAAAFNEFNQRQLVLASETTGGIELFFTTLAGDMKALGRRPEVQQLDEIQTRQELRYMFEKLEPLGVNDVGILNADGVLEYNVAAPQLEGTDFSWRAYYQEAKEMRAGDAYIIEFIEFQGADTGEKGVLVAVPLFETAVTSNNPTPSGKFAGVVLSTLKLNTITQNFVAPIKSSQHGHAFLIDDQYNLLWSSDKTLFGKNLMEETEEFPSLQLIVERMIAGSAGMGEYSYYKFEDSAAAYGEDEEEKLIAYAPILLGNELWSVGIWAPKENARQAIRTVYFRQLSLVGLSILTILLASLYALALSYRASTALEQEVENKVGELLELESELVKLRKAVETSGEVIFMTDREGIITYINPAFTKLYGYSAKEVINRVTPRILKSGMMSQQDYELFWETLLSKQVVKKEMINRCQDGRLVTIGASANPILDDKETIVGFLAIQRDITERKQAEAQIRRRNQELAVLNAIATTVSQSLDVNQILNDALDEVLQLDMFGGMAKGMLFRLNEGQDTLSLAAHRGAPADHPCLVSPPQLGECLCGLAAQQGEVIICKDGEHDPRHTRYWATMPEHQDICLPLKVRGKVLGAMNMRLPANQEIADVDIKLLTAVSDQISVAIENAQLFEAVSRQRGRLRVLAAQLAEAEESERRQLARELHDQVGQNLTALGINLHIIRSSLPENNHGDAASRIDESLVLVEQTTERIRDIMSDLRPPMLDDYGLLSALRWYGEQMALRTGLSVNMLGNGEKIPQLPPSVENALFRITQEALTNVTKHAQAQNAAITVTAEENIIRLIIADDGIGFDPVRMNDVHDSQGWGLLIMAERAESVNGRFQINSQSETGTQIIVEIKL